MQIRGTFEHIRNASEPETAAVVLNRGRRIGKHCYAGALQGSRYLGRTGGGIVVAHDCPQPVNCLQLLQHLRTGLGICQPS